MRTSHLSFLSALLGTCLFTFAGILPAQAKEAVPQGIYEISSAVDTDFVLDVKHCSVDDTTFRIFSFIIPWM